jgi:predicted small lipoprotein YifL
MLDCTLQAVRGVPRKNEDDMRSRWPGGIFLALAVASGLAACGKKGPLYLPKDKPASQQAPQSGSGNKQAGAPQQAQPASQQPAGAAHDTP